MKRIASILLFTILLLQTGGMLLIYKMQQFAIWQEMQQKLNDNKTPFQKITLSLSEYQENKINAHEIFIDGRMYDFKTVRITNDNIELLVIYDEKEENILNEIKDFTNKTKQSNRDFPNQLQELISQNYISPDSDHLFFIPSLDINVFSSSTLNFISNDSEISTPPPKSV